MRFAFALTTLIGVVVCSVLSASDAVVTDPPAVATAEDPPAIDSPVPPPSPPPVDLPVRSPGEAPRSVRPTLPPSARRPGVPGSAIPVPVQPLPARPADGRFALTLKNGTRVIGKPVAFSHIPVGTSFGDARIPISVIASLRSVPNATWKKIHFRNGDVVSVTVKAKTMRFKTSYGEITVPLSDVVEFRQGASFSNGRTRQPSGRRPAVGSPRPHTHTHTGTPFGIAPRGGPVPIGGGFAVPDRSRIRFRR